MQKKAITPIVTLSLLLFLTIISTITYQIWFNSYQSDLFDSISTSYQESFNIDLFNENLYILSSQLENPILISSIKINGINCYLGDSEYIEQKEIDLSHCINLVPEEESLLKITTVSDKTVTVRQFSRTATTSQEILEPSLNCDSLDGGEWIFVEGNDLLGTDDFCVMKYEPSVTPASEPFLSDVTSMSCGSCPTNGSVVLNSTPFRLPLKSTSMSKARTLCENFGPGYTLMTNEQYVTMARDIESNYLNWYGGVVGENFMFSGNNDGSARNPASDDDLNGYYGTNDSLSSCDTRYNNFDISENTISGRACAGQRRTFFLTNGEVIWDLAGSLQEWTNSLLIHNTESALGFSSSAWREQNTIVGYDFMRSLNDYNSSFGFGRILTYGNSANPPSQADRAIRRGGQSSDGVFAGIYSGTLNRIEGQTQSTVTGRCTYTTP